METSITLERRFAIIDEWVLNLDVSDRAVRLYAVLARYADSETHKAYPSRGTLAERLRCSRASVDRASQELVEAGAMTKKQRHNSSVIYTLQVSAPLQRGVVSGDQGGSAPVMRGVLTSDDLTRTTQLEPLNNINAQFDEFWNAYPRKKGKGQARKAFEKALEKTDLVTILAGVAAYVANEDLSDPQFVAHPSTWLNGERWEDEHIEVKVVSKSPYVGGEREWVRDMHNLGEHFECRVGEFGCK